MSNDLEDAIKLTDKCCDKRDLVTYSIEMYLTCGGGGEIHLICANCRMDHRWIMDNKDVYKLRQISDEDLYKSIEYHTWFLRRAKEDNPKYIDYFAKKLGLDKDRLEKLLK